MKRWTIINLSIRDKVVIAKLSLLPQFKLLETTRIVRIILFKFTSKNKDSKKGAFEKVKRNILCQEYIKRDLGLISIQEQQRVFLLRWIEKISTHN